MRISNDKIWRLTSPSSYTSRLASEAGISALTAQILINRGISDSASAEAFLSPRLSDLTDPMLLKDMEKAIELIMNAIEEGKQITVYGDYDADGLTGTALLLNLFSNLGIHASAYIPKRLEEGYSLNPGAIERIASDGTGLIITVDCGISNIKEIELARRLGMDVVVTDHHQIPEDFEPVCPVINPNRSDSLFPFRGLAGVGVAFYLAIGTRTVLREKGWFRDRPEPDLRRYLDLVALGTVADMVPLIGQNRILVHSGMEVMKYSQWPGIKAMQNLSGMAISRISSYDLAFKLAPRLNAPGRMEDAAIGLRTLVTDNASEAADMARQLNTINAKRQAVEAEILEQIEEKIIPGLALEDRRTMVISAGGWHQGVLGIVASRLLNRYHRPTLVLTIRDGIAVGSGRSIDGFNLYRALVRLSHLFEKFGGHHHAAGVTLKESNIEALAAGLEEIAREEMNEEDLIPAVQVDAEVEIRVLTRASVGEIESLAPFGSGNPAPVLYSGPLEVVGSWVVGENHLKLRVRQGNSVMEAIGFRLADRRPIKGTEVNIVFTPEINRWQGNERLQLKITDLEPSDGRSRLIRQKGE